MRGPNRLEGDKQGALFDPTCPTLCLLSECVICPTSGAACAQVPAANWLKNMQRMGWTADCLEGTMPTEASGSRAIDSGLGNHGSSQIPLIQSEFSGATRGNHPSIAFPDKARFEGAAIASCFLLVGVLHHVIPHTSVFWHTLFQWLYYALVVFAAARFGLRGGLVASAAAVIGYIPHLADPDSPVALENYSAQLIVLVLTSAVTGMLADRERRRREQLQAALDELDRVHRELQAGVEQLRRADRLSAVGQLAASLAHEIRNPLASIQGAVSALDHGGAADETCREMRGIIWKECGRLQRLLTGMLDFARPHAAEYRMADVSQKLDSVINLVVHTATKNGITLRKEVSPGIPSLKCDPEQITQVVLNLALNAIQAMPEGGEIVLSARQQGSNILMEVRDQGFGVDCSHLDKIFDPFFTTKENGTGLGLAVAHQIVSQHGGRIKVENNLDKGMTFSVILPLRNLPLDTIWREGGANPSRSAELQPEGVRRGMSLSGELPMRFAAHPQG